MNDRAELLEELHRRVKVMRSAQKQHLQTRNLVDLEDMRSSQVQVDAMLSTIEFGHRRQGART